MDHDEIFATSGCPVPEAAVRFSVNRSEEAYAAYLGKDLLCVFGVTVHEQVQVPWLLGSIYIDRHPLIFWRCSKMVVSHLRGKYPLMANMVWGRYAQALRWVEGLGFTISPPEKWGWRGDLFCRATMVTQKIDLSIPKNLVGLRNDELRRLIHV